MEDFKNCKVGDKVISKLFGVGRIYNMDCKIRTYEGFTMIVDFGIYGRTLHDYNYKGQLYGDDNIDLTKAIE